MFSKIFSATGYYLAYPFLYVISITPFWLLYLISDLIYFTIYYLVGYRKAVVLQNLRNAFPAKGDDEIRHICKEFYRWLCDLLLESLKTLTISPMEMKKRCRMTEQAEMVFSRFADDGKNVIIVMGHFGNWEWSGNTFSLVCRQRLFVIYHALSNQYFDRLMYKMRTRFGTKLIEMNETLRSMVANRKVLSAVAFIADQTPAPAGAFWTKFLNQDTAIYWGTEKIAQKFNYPIVYVSVKRVKRGFYDIQAEVIVENPKDRQQGEISEMHTRRLEKDILDQPETWLWSHRRWKYARE